MPPKGAYGLAVSQATPGGGTRAAPATDGQGWSPVTPKERDGRKEKVVGVDDGDGGDIVMVLIIWMEMEKLK